MFIFKSRLFYIFCVFLVALPARSDEPARVSVPVQDEQFSSRTLDLRTAEIFGLGASPKGDKLALALDGLNEYRFHGRLVVAKGNQYDRFENKDLPKGYRWYDPTFYPDGERLVVASRCISAHMCGEENVGWNLWRVNLNGLEPPQKLTEPQKGMIRWKPYISQDNTVYYVVVEEGGYIINNASAIAKLDPNGNEVAVFPSDAFEFETGFSYRKTVFLRGVFLQQLSIIYVSKDELLFKGRAMNRLSLETLERYKKYKRGPDQIAWNYKPKDPRVLKLSAWMRGQEQTIAQSDAIMSVNETKMTLFEVTADTAKRSDLISPTLQNRLGQRDLFSFRLGDVAGSHFGKSGFVQRPRDW
ncbi:TolB-like translocation protein [Flexibacterium corallicola]|uniref:hypothetical protein n=1 Tax=Flexibacterium corallicola TaxID=3037259 RepID=UPI00286EBA83|nr:hypothetical protein [Pseudovibrio sp. M1P-2-3]